jgi:hypothetical protein
VAVEREFGFWLARGAVCHRRLAGRPLAPGRAPEGHAPIEKKWPVSLGCRGLLVPPNGVWGWETLLEITRGKLGGTAPGTFPRV